MTSTTVWRTRPLGSVAAFYAGSSLPKGEPFSSQQDGYLLLRVSDMNLPGNEIFIKTAQQWSATAGPKSATCPPGSLVIPKRGGAIGTNKKRIATRSCVLDPNLMAISPSSQLDIGFLYQWFLTFDLTIITSGSTVPQLNKQDLDPLSLPFPPIDEQRRIAAILDRAEALRMARRSSMSSLSQLVIAAFGVCFTRADLAERVPLARALAAPPSYGTMIPPAETGGFLSLRVKNIQNASLDLSDTKYIDLPLKDWPRHSVEDGDLLMARAIGSLDHLGKCIVAYPGDARWAFDSHLMRIRLDREVMLPEYVRVWLLTPGGRAAFLRIARRSAVQHNVNTKEIAAFPVPIPPIAKQRAFVEYLHAIEAEQRLMASSLAGLDRLFRSLQYRAFAGAL